jgi:hypothetical protein
MNNRASGLLAVAEVLLVMFGVLKLIGVAVTSSPVWQAADPLQRNMLGHTVMMGVPIAWLLLTRRDLAASGLWTHDARGDVKVALTAFLPVSLAGAVSGFGRRPPLGRHPASPRARPLLRRDHHRPLPCPFPGLQSVARPSAGPRRRLDHFRLLCSFRGLRRGDHV